MRLPFNLILIRAFRLIDMIVMADSLDLEMVLREELELLLAKSGWTESDFDISLLDFIDNNWFPHIN